MLVGRRRVAPKLVVEINGETMFILSSVKYLRSYELKDGEPQENVRIGVGESLKNVGAMKMM